MLEISRDSVGFELLQDPCTIRRAIAESVEHGQMQTTVADVDV